MKTGLERFIDRYGEDYEPSFGLESITNKSLSKHDKIIQDIVHRLNNNSNRLILNNHDYDVKLSTGFTHGEADILMITPMMSYAIEVKTTDTNKAYQKAKHQLWKDNRFINANWYTNKIIDFYVTKSNNDKGYNIKMRKIR